MGFMSDRFDDGRSFRTFNVIAGTWCGNTLSGYTSGTSIVDAYIVCSRSVVFLLGDYGRRLVCNHFR